MSHFDLTCKATHGSKDGTLKCARGVGHEGDHACKPPVPTPDALGRELVIWARGGGPAHLVTERVQPAEADG
mgnify:CR=1 FL=1